MPQEEGGRKRKKKRERSEQCVAISHVCHHHLPDSISSPLSPGEQRPLQRGEPGGERKKRKRGGKGKAKTTLFVCAKITTISTHMTCASRSKRGGGKGGRGGKGV